MESVPGVERLQVAGWASLTTVQELRDGPGNVQQPKTREAGGQAGEQNEAEHVSRIQISRETTVQTGNVSVATLEAQAETRRDIKNKECKNQSELTGTNWSADKLLEGR